MNSQVNVALKKATQIPCRRQCEKSFFVWGEACTKRNGEVGLSNLMLLEILTGIGNSRARRKTVIWECSE